MGRVGRWIVDRTREGERGFLKGNGVILANAFPVAKRYQIVRSETLSEDESLQVEVVGAGTARARLLRQPDAGIGHVARNKILTKEGAPVKRHIEIELPKGMTYRTGDYLAM